MKDFEQNKCRLCRKILCCSNCRIHHEREAHKIHVECDVCVYGKIIVKDASSSLLQHLKSTHWPLHCVHCNIIISSIDELLSEHKCPLVSSKLTIMLTPSSVDGDEPPALVTPKTRFVDNNIQVPSPVVLTPFYRKFMSENTSIGMTISTSTPMQIRQGFLSPQDILTPIDLLEMKTAYKSSLKLTASSGTPNNSKKSERRVTFSETPLLGMPKKQETLAILQKCEEKEETQDDLSEYTFHSVSNSEIRDCCNDKENVVPVDFDNKDENLWESACTNMENSWSGLYLTSDSRVVETIDENEDPPSHCDRSTSLWTSMTQVVKSVMSSLPPISELSLMKKRPSPEEFSDDEDQSANRYKRMKFSQIKCRRAIRDLGPLHQIRLARPKCVDKSTQTEDDMFV